MSAQVNEPRRWKLPSELDDDERAAAQRIGGSSKVERPEYTAWRTTMLGTERDDLALRSRLLEEEESSLRRRAGERRTSVLDSMRPEDHAAHLDAIREARETKLGPLWAGEEPKLPDAGAAELEAKADRLDEERAEIDSYGEHLHEEAA